MRFSRLEISHVRNLTAVDLDLAPGLNLFHGPNGAGKTALLEAVHLLCRGRSFRTQRSQGLIQQGQDTLRVRAGLEDELRGVTRLAIQKNRHARTELRLNGHAERRLSEIARLTPLQVMLPDMAELVFGSPGRRRSWLDWGTFHVKPDYLDRLRGYLRAVRQRNAALKAGGGRAAVRPWSEEVARLGAQVNADREEYLDLVEPYVTAMLSRLAPELELELRYQAGWPPGGDLHKLLGQNLAREVKYGATQWGPHRADLVLRASGASAGAILSRGQAKLVASALLMAQAALLADRERRSTVFLIDDAGAELDAAHNEWFFALLLEIGGQILATTTREPDSERPMNAYLESGAVFHVEQGSVVKETE